MVLGFLDLEVYFFLQVRKTLDLTSLNKLSFSLTFLLLGPLKYGYQSAWWCLINPLSCICSSLFFSFCSSDCVDFTAVSFSSCILFSTESGCCWNPVLKFVVQVLYSLLSNFYLVICVTFYVFVEISLCLCIALLTSLIFFMTILWNYQVSDLSLFHKDLFLEIYLLLLFGMYFIISSFFPDSLCWLLHIR